MAGRQSGFLGKITLTEGVQSKQNGRQKRGSFRKMSAGSEETISAYRTGMLKTRSSTEATRRARSAMMDATEAAMAALLTWRLSRWFSSRMRLAWVAPSLMES
jgi:hypothetical protein